MRTVLAALLTGKMYIDVQKDAILKKLPYMHKNTFNRYLGVLTPKIEELTEETVDLIPYLVVRVRPIYIYIYT